MSRTKIVCTIGPVSNTPEMLREFVEAGMSIARLNGSHADLDWHRETINTLRSVAPDIPILLDVPGRKIRTIQLDVEPEFKAGDTIILTTDTSHDGSDKVPVNNSSLHQKLSPGNAILADDGTLRFTVIDINGQDIICRAECNGILRSRKGINVPFVDLGGALVTDRDRSMMEFAIETGVDYVGISFVESAHHIEMIRELSRDNSPLIVSKVENRGGLDNLEEITEATDAIMIDRGDLSVETDLQNVALYQKRIIEAGRRCGKPVIVATEMLHTMIANPFPTKAEVSDISNAVLDGCSATMLSGETAVGEFPLEVITLMREVCDAAAEHSQNNFIPAVGRNDATVPQAIEDAAALVCRELPITKIVAITRSGYAARMIAARNPSQNILAVVDNLKTARALNLVSGTTGVFVDVHFPKDGLGHVGECLEQLWSMGHLELDDLILITMVTFPKSGNRMNMIATYLVSDLAETLSWNTDN
jgi:pyruvate kinase